MRVGFVFPLLLCVPLGAFCILPVCFWVFLLVPSSNIFLLLPIKKNKNNYIMII